MQIGICDDEKAVQEVLREKVKEFCPEAEIVLYQSGEELLLAESRPDILFLDIQMPGKNGMETARALRKRGMDTILIFVTVIEEYVFQAFDVGAFHYLVKPFEQEKFAEVLRNAIKQKINKKANETEFPKKESPCLMITTDGKHLTVNLKDIVYAEVFNRKIIIHTMDGEIEYYGKMKELEQKAGELFYRSHRAYLVNLGYITKYNATTIWLEKGQALMAKQNYPEFVKRYLKYNQQERRE